MAETELRAALTGYFAVFVACILAFLAPSPSAHARERSSFDAAWRFALGDEPARAAPAFDDSGWRRLDLPHDWSIEGAPKADAPSTGHGGFFPTGTGWYRKHFAAPRAWAERAVRVEFEGVYENAEVWLNGVRLGAWPYGYTSFGFDLMPHLKLGAENVLAVRVDNSAQPNSRWYSGSGIYRHVWLEVLDPIRLERDELTITTTRLDAVSAEVRVAGVVRHDADPTGAKLSIETTLRDPAGRVAAREQRPLAAAGFNFTLNVPRPQPWSPESPALYRAEVRLLRGRKAVDELSLSVGLRTVAFSAERGFELNGRSVELLGSCVHHDHGPLGAASFDAAEERKVRLLKAAGFNAVRTSHNPPAPAFLDACDRLGLVVIDEAFDGWAKKKTEHDYARVFPTQWRTDLGAMVRRDRNHPSVILWSIGNEMYERGNAAGLKLAQEMSAFVRELDPLRGVTAGLNGMGKPEEWPKLDPLFAALDVAGYNYEIQRAVADHARVPQRVIVTTESYQSEVFLQWQAARDHAFVIGDFVWSGIDYLGEAGIGEVFPPGEKVIPHWEGVHFPWHGAYCGDIDLTGWRKPVSHYRNIVWDRGEKLYAVVRVLSPDGRPWEVSKWAMPPALPSWTWPGHEGKTRQLEVFSRHPRVQVFVNDRLVGERITGETEAFRALLDVPYAAGRLRVVGLDVSGGVAEEFVLETAGAPAKLRLTVERTKLISGRDDVAFATLEVCDAQGRWCPAANDKIEFSISGPASIAGVGSGNLRDNTPYVSTTRAAYEGRALVVIRPNREGRGTIRLSARVPGLTPSVVEFSLASKR